MASVRSGLRRLLARRLDADSVGLFGEADISWLQVSKGRIIAETPYDVLSVTCSPNTGPV